MSTLHEGFIAAFPRISYVTGDDGTELCSKWCRFNLKDTRCCLYGKKEDNQRLPYCRDAGRAINYMHLKETVDRARDIPNQFNHPDAASKPAKAPEEEILNEALKPLEGEKR
jgi:hypothetical protein